MENIKSGHSFVLFGATGNLAQIKIMPALCRLFVNNDLPESLKIIAFGRRNWKDEDYHNFIKPSLKNFRESEVNSFIKTISFISGTFDDNSSYLKIKEKIGDNEALYHLAVLPESFAIIAEGLGKNKMKGKLLIEKPFGHDQESAMELQTNILEYFEDKDVYRIDHYLGKPGLQAILERRLNDEVFESRLSSEYVSKIECRHREVIGVNGRGEFYEANGALLDVGQNHLLEMLSYAVLLSLPVQKKEEPNPFYQSYDPSEYPFPKNHDDLAPERALAISTLEFPSDASKVKRGQYAGYKDEPGVDPNSEVETYFRVETTLGSDRFLGVDIVLEGGKRLEVNERKEDVTIYFKDGSMERFDIDMPKKFNSYEIIIKKAIEGDKSVFVDIVEMSVLWKFTDKVKKLLDKSPLIIYTPGGKELE